MQPLEYQIGQLLKDKGLTLSLAESCTGGLISHLITNVPGSSAYFLGGVVAYAYEAKVKLLGVSWDTLKKYGAVSCETVIEMADGVRRVLNADIGLSVCCIAGPGGATPTKPVGTGRVGLATPNGSWAKDFLFNFDRIGNKEAMAHGALHLLLTYLTQVHI
jgi:PncC family amidohydrolase